MSDFLKDYKDEAAPSDYMKLVDGRNTFRVLSSAITGWVYFTDGEDGKREPHRVKSVKEVPAAMWRRRDDRPKKFWAFVVYNRNTEEIQILDLKQTGIQDQIKALVDSPKWGDPKEYDLVINKVSTGPQARDVEYSVMPEPKEPLDKGVIKAYQDMAIDLSALYRGEDPFATGEEGSSEQIADDAVKAGL